MSALRVLALAVLLAIVLILPGAGGPLAAAALWLACIVLLARSHPQRMMSLAFVYLVLLGLFHLGMVVPLELGVRTVEVPSWASSPQLGTALKLFCLATVAFTLGARLRAPPPGPDATAAHARDERRGGEAPLFGVGFVVAALGGAMLWVGVRQLGIFAVGYAEFFERAMSEDVRFFGMGLMVFPIGLLVAAVGATRRQMYVLALMLGVVLGPLFLAGFRGPLIVQATALLAVWARKDRPVARRIATIGLAAAIVLVPVVRLTRDREGPSPRAAQVDPGAVLLETGGTIYPLVVTVERIAAGDRLWLGRSYAMAAKRILPNVAARWSRPSERVLTPGAWATMYADLWAFEHGGGIGYSAVAEPYLNFGVPGVVLVFLLLGYLVQRCDDWLGREPYRAAIGAASFGYVLWTVRNDSMELFRALAFAGAIVLAAWLLKRLWRGAGARSASPAAV